MHCNYIKQSEADCTKQVTFFRVWFCFSMHCTLLHQADCIKQFTSLVKQVTLFRVLVLLFHALHVITSSLLHQAGYSLSCFGSMNFWTKVTRASIFKHCLQARVTRCLTFMKSIVATSANHIWYALCLIRVAFNCNVAISIHAASHKPLHPRQWPEVSDFVARFCTLHVILAWP